MGKGYGQSFGFLPVFSRQSGINKKGKLEPDDFSPEITKRKINELATLALDGWKEVKYEEGDCCGKRFGSVAERKLAITALEIISGNININPRKGTGMDGIVDEVVWEIIKLENRGKGI